MYEIIDNNKSKITYSLRSKSFRYEFASVYISNSK